MKTLLSRTRCLAPAWMWALLCAFGLVLAGCGGGGASSTTSAGGGSGSGTTGNGRTGTTVSSGSATLTGVVAVGTPVLSGTVRVYDALGVDQGSATTSAIGGSYSLTLSTTSRSLPLFIQASGSDMTGAPVVVHSVVHSLSTTAPTTVNVTSLTDAVVALLLGGEPAGFFAAPTAYAAWAQLSDSTALALATTFFKTVIAANLRDAGLTNTATVNLFSDPAFVANKTGVDGALEGLRIQFGRDITNSHPVIQISNRLVLSSSTEVSIDLTTASGLLAGRTSAIDNTTVLTSAKATTGSSTIMPSVSGLNTLTASINVALARRYGLLEMLGEPFFSDAYTYFNGRTRTETVDDLVAYGAAGYQLSDFQILGCLDDPVALTGCTKIAVAALMRDGSNTVVGVFRNTVSYTASTGWRLRGNDRQTPWYLHSAAWHSFDGNGGTDAATRLTGEAPKQGTGIHAIVIAREFMRATIVLPNNGTQVFNHCDLVNWTPMCLESVETGDLIRDQVMHERIDVLDTPVGARYRIQTETVGNGTEDNTMRLTAGPPVVTSTSVFPLPDSIATSPVTIGGFISGLTVSWADWAAANPQLRMVEVRGVIRSTTSAPIKEVVPILPLSGTQATLQAFTAVPGDAETFVLWLTAEDAQGRHYISKITAQP